MPYGSEYVVNSAQEPNLYIIRKQLRVTPDKMVPLAAYYVLDGSIYQAPHLQAVLGSRAERSLYYVQSAFAKVGLTLKDHLREEEEDTDTAMSREPTAKAEEEPVDRAEAFHMDQIITSVLRKLPPPEPPVLASDAPGNPKVAEPLPAEATTSLPT